ncbi:MAG: alpha/beta hydrolase [Acidimicrobiia bacterium]
MEFGFVSQGATEIAFQFNGTGDPILFIHAGVADSRMWQRQMNLPGYRCVAFDQRGFGQTRWAPGTYAEWRDAVTVLDHLEIDSAVVVGCSFGASVAMNLALEVPDRVTALVLVGAAAEGWEPKDGWPEDPIWDEAMAASEAGDLSRVIEIDAKLWLAGPGRELDQIDPEMVDLFLEMGRTPAATEKERQAQVERYESATNDRLDEITAPTLVVVGAHDQPDLIESADYLAARLSEEPVLLIENAAHLPSLEEPETFNQGLMSFLSNV